MRRLQEMIWQDALYALRALRHNPAFTATAVLTWRSRSAETRPCSPSSARCC